MRYNTFARHSLKRENEENKWWTIIPTWVYNWKRETRILYHQLLFFPMHSNVIVKKKKILQKQDIPSNQKIKYFIFCKITLYIYYIYTQPQVTHCDVVQCGNNVLNNPLKGWWKRFVLKRYKKKGITTWTFILCERESEIEK